MGHLVHPLEATLTTAYKMPGKCVINMLVANIVLRASSNCNYVCTTNIKVSSGYPGTVSWYGAGMLRAVK